MENFQLNSAPPNIKYNFVVLFLSQLYILFIYIFSKTTIMKGMSEFMISSQKAKFIDVPAAYIGDVRGKPECFKSSHA